MLKGFALCQLPNIYASHTPMYIELQLSIWNTHTIADFGFNFTAHSAYTKAFHDSSSFRYDSEILHNASVFSSPRLCPLQAPAALAYFSIALWYFFFSKYLFPCSLSLLVLLLASFVVMRKGSRYYFPSNMCIQY